MKDMILVGYVDKIIISWSDPQERTKFEQELMNEFSTKSLGQMMYFVGIEVAHSSKEILLSQQKYTLDLFTETGFVEYQPVKMLIKVSHKLTLDEKEQQTDIGCY